LRLEGRLMVVMNEASVMAGSEGRPTKNARMR
jgi:hypothetical protein